MSAEASNWARRMHTGSPSTKALLMVLADIADNEGHIRYISSGYLSDCCELSRSAVFNHLRRLERGGVFERDDGGHRETGAKVVTGRLILEARFKAPEDDLQNSEAVHQVDSPEGEGVHHVDSLEEGAVHQVDSGQSTTWTGGSPPRGLPPYRNNTGKQYQENNTPTPTTDSISAEGEREAISRSGPSDGEGATEGTLDAWVAKFCEVYPLDATASLSDVRVAASRLSIKDRARALRWASVYAADLKARKRSHPLNPARWLLDRRFEEVEQIKGGQARSQGLSKPVVFVAKGTPAFDAWTDHYRRAFGRSPPDSSRLHGKNGWWFETLWPPGVGETGPPAAAE